MNLLPYSIDEVHSITRLSQVERYMCRLPVIDSRSWDVPNLSGHSTETTRIYIDRNLKQWPWLGKPVDIKRFLILRELYTSALIDALRELTGRERQELLVRMRMVNADDGPVEHSYSVAMGAVAHAVKLQYGDSGFRSFQRFIESQSKLLAGAPPAKIPLDLRRVP